MNNINDLWNKLLQQRVITSSGCWRYTGNILPNGYGQIMFNYKNFLVHRISAHINLGLDLSNHRQLACHKDDICKHRDCFNPDHLYLGSYPSNVQDSVKSKTHSESRRTHCSKGHEFTKENTSYIRNKHRRCKICHREENRKSEENRRKP
jgi:hypothetical protein